MGQDLTFISSSLPPPPSFSSSSSLLWKSWVTGLELPLYFSWNHKCVLLLSLQCCVQGQVSTSVYLTIYSTSTLILIPSETCCHIVVCHGSLSTLIHFLFNVAHYCLAVFILFFFFLLLFFLVQLLYPSRSILPQFHIHSFPPCLQEDGSTFSSHLSDLPTP